MKEDIYDFIEDYEDEDGGIIEDIIYDKFFTEFLLEHNCYGKYLDNIRTQCLAFSYVTASWSIRLTSKSISSINSWLDIIIKDNAYYLGRLVDDPERLPYYVLMFCVFLWPGTPEGDPYWRKLYYDELPMYLSRVTP